MTHITIQQRPQLVTVPPWYRRHQVISYTKSAIRIVGFAALFGPAPLHLWIASVFLIVAEIIGIVEEIGHD